MIICINPLAFVRERPSACHETPTPGKNRNKSGPDRCTNGFDANIRILRDEGALGFTTTKVAEEAGVGVGSLYQYFPNKQSIVVALHDENIDQGWVAVIQILDHTRWTPRRKLTEITRWFSETEAIEAQTFGKAAGDLHLFLHADGGRSASPSWSTRRLAGQQNSSPQVRQPRGLRVYSSPQRTFLCRQWKPLRNRSRALAISLNQHAVSGPTTPPTCLPTTSTSSLKRESRRDAAAVPGRRHDANL